MLANLCTINDTAEHVLLVLCICGYVRVHLLGRRGGGCRLAMSVSATRPLYGVIDKWKLIHTS